MAWGVIDGTQKLGNALALPELILLIVSPRLSVHSKLDIHEVYLSYSPLGIYKIKYVPVPDSVGFLNGSIGADDRVRSMCTIKFFEI